MLLYCCHSNSVYSMYSSNVRMANVARQHEDVWLSVCHAGSCELCGMPYINSWLECIQFVAVGKVSSLVKPGVCQRLINNVI